MIDRVNNVVRKLPAWVLYLLAPIPPAWFFYLGMTGGLGVEPIKALEHRLGELGLQVLLLTLSITPLRRFAGLNLIKFRRALGLIGFFYIALHLLVWLVLDVRILSQILTDIAKRPYITIGMVGFALMVPLAFTSNNWSVRKLGPRWRKLHKLFYIALPLGALHFVMLVKGIQLEPMLYLGTTLILLGMRQFPKQGRKLTKSNRDSIA